MVFYAVVNIILDTSRRQVTYPCISWLSPVLGMGYEVSCFGMVDKIERKNTKNKRCLVFAFVSECDLPRKKSKD